MTLKLTRCGGNVSGASAQGTETPRFNENTETIPAEITMKRNPERRGVSKAGPVTNQDTFQKDTTDRCPQSSEAVLSARGGNDTFSVRWRRAIKLSLLNKKST